MRSTRGGGIGRVATALATGLTLAAVGAACGDPDQAADGAGSLPTVPVRVAELQGPAPELDGSNSLVEIRGVHFGLAGPYNDSTLVRSEDLRTWEPVTLPEAPERVELAIWGPPGDSGELVVTGRGVETVTPGQSPTSHDVAVGTFAVWTTTDGDTWSKGLELDDLNPLGVPRVIDAGGVLLTGSALPDGRFVLHHRDGSGDWQSQELTAVSRAVEPSPLVQGMGNDRADVEDAWVEGDTIVGIARWSTDWEDFEIRSADRGVTWQVAPCTDRDHTCGGFGLRAEGLLIRGDRSSTDEGATWDSVTVGPVEEEHCSLRISAAVKVATGWSAVGRGGGAGGPVFDGLLHSEDGRSWTVVRAPNCDAPGEGAYSYTEPVRFNGSWWTVYMPYDHLSTEPPRPLLLRSGDGREWTEVSVPGLDGRLAGTPIVMSDELLIPLSTIDANGDGQPLEGFVGLRAQR